jgi:signal transduction histidine kinase
MNREYLELARKSTDSLIRIIDDVLDYSKIEAGKILIENNLYNIAEVVSEVVELFSISIKHKELAIRVDIDKDSPMNIYGDAVRLRQVLSNLISNAVKFTSDGEIAVIVKGDKLHNDMVRFKFTVKDTGIGIPKDKQNELFERFKQLDSSYKKKYQGTGLGLAISKKLVELMGGEIWIESEEHLGSSFNFTLVAKKEE